jgi:hypothetical protein
MYQMRISTNKVSSVMLRPKKLEIWKKKCVTLKEPGKKISQTHCHEIEPNLSKDRTMHEGDNPLFWNEFIKFYFFHDSSMHIRIIKELQVPKYLAARL